MRRAFPWVIGGLAVIGAIVAALYAWGKMKKRGEALAAGAAMVEGNSAQVAESPITDDGPTGGV